MKTIGSINIKTTKKVACIVAKLEKEILKKVSYKKSDVLMNKLPIVSSEDAICNYVHTQFDNKSFERS